MEVGAQKSMTSVALALAFTTNEKICHPPSASLDPVHSRSPRRTAALSSIRLALLDYLIENRWNTS